MAKEAEILNPVRAVQIGADKVDVRELKWADALSFIRALGSYAGLIWDEQGNLHFTVDGIGKLIAQSEELAESLITKSTGKDKAWIDNLDLSQALDLIDAALSINLEVIKKKGQTMAARMKPMTTGPTPSPTPTPKNESAASTPT